VTCSTVVQSNGYLTSLLPREPAPKLRFRSGLWVQLSVIAVLKLTAAVLGWLARGYVALQMNAQARRAG